MTGAAPSATDREQAANLLDKLADQNAWLACACQDSSLAKSPILYPQKTRTGSRTLVRNYDRASHTEVCPFYRLRTESGDIPSHSVRKPMSGAFGVLTNATDGTDTTENSPDERTYAGAVGTPKLARILFTILEKAGLNVVSRDGPLGITPQYNVLRDALKTFSFDTGKQKNVSDYTETRVDEASFRSLARKLTHSTTWPPPLKPQGFLIGIVRELDGRRLICGKGSDLPEVRGRVVRPGENTPGPYLVIVLVGRLNNESDFSPLRAFVHPVMSASLLIPVDSNLERETLKILLDRQRLQKDNYPFKLVKPLIDLRVGEPETAVRPDFILDYGVHKVVVETMGYSDPDYLQRKERTHATMAVIGPVIKHGIDGDADRLLKSAIHQSMSSPHANGT